MRRLSLLFMLFLCLPLGMGNNSLSMMTLRIGTMDLPPYGWTDQQGEKHGIIYELNQEIAAKSGLPFDNQIIPFNRMFKMLSDGELDFISSQAHQPALDAGEKLAVQHLVKVVAVTRRGSSIHTLNDLKKKKLIYHHGASYPQLEGFSEAIERVSSYRDMVQLLSTHHHLDAGIITEPAFYYWASDLKLDPSKDFGDIIVIEDNKPQWIFVRRNLPEDIKKRIKEATMRLYQEKAFDRLKNKYRSK